MKQISILITATLLLFSSFAIAGGDKDGEKFNGTVKYKITAEGREITPTEQAQMPTESISYYLGNLVRSDNITPMGSMNTIINTDTKEMILLLEQMGQKYSLTISSEDMKKAEAAAKSKDSTDAKPDYQLMTGSKTIAGYSCKKAEVLSGETKIVMYYTEEISAEQKEFKDAPGFVLYYEIDMPDDELYLIYQATEVIVKKPKKKIFSIPSDYEEMPDAFKTQVRASLGL